jgi:hypothetical protein
MRLGCPLCAKSRHSGRLFDHLVGQQLRRIRDGKTERLGRLQVNDEFERSRLFNRNIGRLRARAESCRLFLRHVGTGLEYLRRKPRDRRLRRSLADRALSVAGH